MGNEWSKAAGSDPLLLQQSEGMLSLGLSTSNALLQPDEDGKSRAILTNLSCSTQRLARGDTLGEGCTCASGGSPAGEDYRPAAQDIQCQHDYGVSSPEEEETKGGAF